MASVTFGSITITDGTSTPRTYGVAVDPNHSGNYSSLNVIMLSDGSMWGGVTTLNAAQLSATRTNATGSYTPTGQLSDSTDLTGGPGSLEIWATGAIKFTCSDGTVDTRTIGSTVSLPYQLPAIVSRIWATGTDIAAANIKVLKV